MATKYFRKESRINWWIIVTKKSWLLNIRLFALNIISNMKIQGCSEKTHEEDSSLKASCFSQASRRPEWRHLLAKKVAEVKEQRQSDLNAKHSRLKHP